MKECAPLKAYMDRIHATPINFRTYQVKEHKGHYYVEKVLIRIKEGRIEVDDERYLPTDDEAEAIARAWKEADIPTSVAARNLRGLQKLRQQPNSTLYEFYNDDGGIIFVQERVNPKGYLPWSYWSDGVWRMMQPDGPVPFWRAKGCDVKDKIMIHEGAKAAKAASEIDKDHPWYDEFQEYEHWGLVGGTLSVKRADYETLKKRNPSDVLYMCDNDWAGRTVVHHFSRLYRGRMGSVRFDDRFPESFDVADTMPPMLFDKHKFYIGPTIREMREPATWATDMYQAPDKGGKGRKPKPIPTLRDDFDKEWYNVIKPEVYVHRDKPYTLYTRQQFDSHISPFSDVKELSALVNKSWAGKSYGLCYMPHRNPASFNNVDGTTYLNTHIGSGIKPIDGDPSPFVDYMKHLIPVADDCVEVMRWIATLLAKPATKMFYGLLMMSEVQGVGKSTLGEKVLKPLLGRWNVSSPSENDVVESQFNSWAANKRLAIIHEIYGGDSKKPYSRLQSIMSEPYININEKFMATYSLENWLHVMAMSNARVPLRLDHNDRRWLVPVVTEDKRNRDYWLKLNEWLAGAGRGIVLNWAMRFNNYIEIGETAPTTKRKLDMIEDSLGPDQRLVYETLLNLGANDGGRMYCTTDKAVIDMVIEINYNGNKPVNNPVTPVKLRRAVRDAGWYINDNRTWIKFDDAGNIVPKDGSSGTFVKCKLYSTERISATTNDELMQKARFVTSSELLRYAREHIAPASNTI